MSKFVKILTITLLCTALLTVVYFFISFDIPGLFNNKLQFSLVPGIIYTLIALKMIAGGEPNSRSDGLYLSKKMNDQTQEERINSNNIEDLESMLIKLAYLSTGIIQIIFGILIGKLS